MVVVPMRKEKEGRRGRAGLYMYGVSGGTFEPEALLPKA